MAGLQAARQPGGTLVYGTQIGKIADMEAELLASPAEYQVVAAYLERARDYEARLQNVDVALEDERVAIRERIRVLRAKNADVGLIVAASRELAALPRDAAAARERWTRLMQENYERAQPAGAAAPQPCVCGLPRRHPEEQQAYTDRGAIFLALMFCLMVALPGCRTCSCATTPRPPWPGRAPRWHGRCSSLPCCTSARRRWRCWSSSR